MDDAKAQGSIVPTLFIGLGGTGSEIVDRIMARAKRLPNWQSHLEKLNSFVAVDTNVFDQKQLNEIPKANRINIAAFDKQTAIDGFRRSKNVQASSWLSGSYIPRPGNKPGAGQIRVESRLGFFYHSPEIRRRIRDLVEAALRPNIAWRQDAHKAFYVHIYASLAGGTGSGSALSMAYLVSDVVREQGWEARVVGHFALSTLLTDLVEHRLHGDIHANTYAALKEIEHMSKLSYDEVRLRGRTKEPFAFWRDIQRESQVPEVSTRPFFITLLYDRPAHISLPDFKGALADDSYLAIFTPLLESVLGELDNYEKRQTELTRYPGDLGDVGQGYTKNFGTLGAAVLRFPADEFLRYAATRFTAEAIRRQMTFGASAEDATSDRALGLAKHAVDYADPRFQRMDEQARFDRINAAFIASVRELARQDEREDLKSGFWYSLVERVDQGRPTGTDAKTGEIQRGETRVQEVGRRLEERRRGLLDRVAIKERGFAFAAESVNQYLDLLANFEADAQTSSANVRKDQAGLVAACEEGEVIRDMKLGPIEERYLVLRLLEVVDQEQLPAAQQENAKAKLRSLQDSRVRERLRRDLFENLQAAAKKKTWLMRPDNEAFESARDEAQEEFRKAVQGTKKALEAEVHEAQLRGLRHFLARRAMDYARLSTRLDALVTELESQAEEMRQGRGAENDRFVLQVEALETLREPRQRLWDAAYRQLFLGGAREFTTYDTTAIAQTIAKELQPRIGEDGRVVQKTDLEMTTDIRNALLALGEKRLAPSILGSGDDPGLDLVEALRLEARVDAGGSPSEDDINRYIKRKIQALAQLAGVHARVDSAQAETFQDGVVVAKKRRVALLGDGLQFPGRFRELVDLATDGLSGSFEVEAVPRLQDPRLAVVLDSELGIPAYYFRAVVGDMEHAYLTAAKNEQRSYDLHTDSRWENGLPNLNPRQSEFTTSWSVDALLRALAVGAVLFVDGAYTWPMPHGESLRLGGDLPAALYELAGIHQDRDLSSAFETALRNAEQGHPDRAARLAALGSRLEEEVARMAKRKREGAPREQFLELPLLRFAAGRARQLATEGSEPGSRPGFRP